MAAGRERESERERERFSHRQIARYTEMASGDWNQLAVSTAAAAFAAMVLLLTAGLSAPPSALAQIFPPPPALPLIFPPPPALPIIIPAVGVPPPPAPVQIIIPAVGVPPPVQVRAPFRGVCVCRGTLSAVAPAGTCAAAVNFCATGLLPHCISVGNVCTRTCVCA